MSEQHQDERPSKEAGGEHKAPCQVTFFMGDEVCRGSSLHFNERGMLIMYQDPEPLNAHLKIILQFPGFKNPIELQGDVVWTNIHGTADSLAPRGMGVKFVNLDRDVERLLAELSERYEAFGSIYSCYYS